MSDVRTWDPARVATWLEDNRFPPEHFPSFSGEDLCALTKADVKDILGGPQGLRLFRLLAQQTPQDAPSPRSRPRSVAVRVTATRRVAGPAKRAASPSRRNLSPASPRNQRGSRSQAQPGSSRAAASTPRGSASSNSSRGSPQRGSKSSAGGSRGDSPRGSASTPPSLHQRKSSRDSGSRRIKPVTRVVRSPKSGTDYLNLTPSARDRAASAAQLERFRGISEFKITPAASDDRLRASTYVVADSDQEDVVNFCKLNGMEPRIVLRYCKNMKAMFKKEPGRWTKILGSKREAKRVYGLIQREKGNREREGYERLRKQQAIEEDVARRERERQAKEDAEDEERLKRTHEMEQKRLEREARIARLRAQKQIAQARGGTDRGGGKRQEREAQARKQREILEGTYESPPPPPDDEDDDPPPPPPPGGW